MNPHNLYSFLVPATFVAAACIGTFLLKTTAPYGRHLRSGWGPAIPARHGWIIMEFPAVAVMAVCFVLRGPEHMGVERVFLILWLLHYIHRTFIYPQLLKDPGKPFPLLLISFGFLFNCTNGFINGYYLFFISGGYSTAWLLDIRFLSGCGLFLFGLFLNIQSDSILRKMRKHGEHSYHIPKNGFFRFISSPNYLGEILEWTGWAVFTWSIPGLAFAVFTIANLLPRSLAHHKWYMNHFPNYPEERKALIPFLL